ncbi:MAG: GNAT family N-acetyltransferase [Synechococcales cyanobacterium RM1_1_8]|nr:GNAT family N-acetyltransferase [Synechococcales cyanobacterium RM1_1_8]
MDFRRLFYFAAAGRPTAAGLSTPAARERLIKSSGAQRRVSNAMESSGDYRIELRRAQPQDLPALTNLLTQCFHSAQRPAFWFESILRFSIQEDLRQRLQYPGAKQACWVAVCLPQAPERSGPERLVGTVELGMQSSFALSWPLSLEAWLAPSHQFLYISNLAVDPGYRRRGIAQKLLQRCEETARGWNQRRLYLHVLESNQAARRLYSLAGFRFERPDPSLESMLLNRDRRQLWRKSLSYPGAPLPKRPESKRPEET